MRRTRGRRCRARRRRRPGRPGPGRTGCRSRRRRRTASSRVTFASNGSRPSSWDRAVLARTTSSGLIRRPRRFAPPWSPAFLPFGRMATWRMSMARRPTASKSWRTVVSGGIRKPASGMSSKPTTLNVVGHRAARLPQRAQDPDGHLVVGDEHGGDVVARGQDLAQLVAARGGPVAQQRLAVAGARRPARTRSTRRAGRGPPPSAGGRPRASTCS